LSSAAPTPASPPPLPKARDGSSVTSAVSQGNDGKRKLPMRTRRLLADAEQVRKAFRGFPLIQIRSISGDPPDLYQIEYFVRGLEPGIPGIPEPRNQHLVEIQLTSEYPRQSPKCKALTPAFHPNIAPVAICVGDHWTASERLVDLIIRIGEMLAYQAYNVNSPLDVPAAVWAEQHAGQLPTDTRDLRPPELT
jgi:ubiquitin-protein ligase